MNLLGVEKRTEVLYVRVSPKVKKDLKDVSKLTGISEAAICNMVLEEYLYANNFKTERKRSHKPTKK